MVGLLSLSGEAMARKWWKEEKKRKKTEAEEERETVKRNNDDDGNGREEKIDEREFGRSIREGRKWFPSRKVTRRKSQGS